MTDTRPSAARRAWLRALAALPAAALPGTLGAAGDTRMLTRTIPASGEALAAVGLGTWQTFDVGGDRAARARLAQVLEAFTAGGGTLVDSSPMYGTAEAVVGDLAAETKLRERLFLATKVWTRGRADGVREMARSLERFRSGKIGLMQVHNLLDLDVHAPTLAEWKKDGRLRYTGITHYTASAHGEVMRQLSRARWDFVQINYSLDEREAEARLLPLAAERGTAVIVNRPFATGGMFRRTKGKPLPAFAAELGIASWAQYFLKWILGHPAVTCVIPATGNPKHAADNVAAGHGPMPDAAMRRRMAEAFEAL